MHAKSDTSLESNLKYSAELTSYKVSINRVHASRAYG